MSSCFTSGLYLRSQDNSVSLFPRSRFSTTIHDETNIFSLCTANPVPVPKNLSITHLRLTSLPSHFQTATSTHKTHHPTFFSLYIEIFPTFNSVSSLSRHFQIFPIFPSTFPCTNLSLIPPPFGYALCMRPTYALRRHCASIATPSYLCPYLLAVYTNESFIRRSQTCLRPVPHLLGLHQRIYLM